MANVIEKPTKLLLHACCGPCSLEPVRLLRERGIDPHIFYANSNIAPAEEYAHRLETISTWASAEGLALMEDAYDPEAWEERVGRKGEAAYARFGIIAGDVEGANGEDIPYAMPTHTEDAERARQERCRACYRLRLERAASYAADAGFDTLATTLTVSPYQYTDIIQEELERACANAGICALFEDYRPYYPEATRRAREAGMYRQNFCGCRFSQQEAAVERIARKRARDIAKAAARAQRAAELAGEEEDRAMKASERKAYAAKQARKHEISRKLRQQEGNVLS